MISVRIRAQRYLDKHKPALADFGAGSFIDQGKFRIIGDLESAKEGKLLIETRGGQSPDCTKLAHDVWEDIYTNDREMRPVIAAYHGNTHFWVEVKDEKRRPIQIDATPWYCKLDPGHKKMREVSPTIFTGEDIGYTISGDNGLVLSVRPVKEKFLTTTMRGFWPRAVLLGDQLAKDLEAGYGLPDLRIILLFRRALGPMSPAQQSTMLRVYFDLIDNQCVGNLELPLLDSLIALDWIRLGALDSSENTMPVSSLSELEGIVKYLLNNEGVEELRKNLDRVLKLIQGSLRQ